MSNLFCHRESCDTLLSVLVVLQTCVYSAQQLQFLSPENASECGVRRVRVPRIVGGTSAAVGAWPWMVSLRHRNDAMGIFKHHCGASLINSRWVITAAHCFDISQNSPDWRVHAQDYRSSPVENHDDYDVILIILHPQYNVSRHGNDLALVRLITPIKAITATPICLPQSPDLRVISNGTRCYVTGWGETKGTGNQAVLKQVELPVIDRRKCGAWYNEIVTSDAFCAGYPFGGRDSCKGDSGGPYACPRGGAWTLVGVVSWGRDCAAGHQPGVYTSVAFHLRWIRRTVHLYDALLDQLGL